MVDTNMDALGWLRKQLDGSVNDVTREMLKTFAEFLMSSEADARCGAPHGVRSPELAAMIACPPWRSTRAISAKNGGMLTSVTRSKD